MPNHYHEIRQTTTTMPKTHKVRPTTLNRKPPKNKDDGQVIQMDLGSQKKRKLSDSEGAGEGLEDEAGDDPVIKRAGTSKIRGKAISGKAISGKASRNKHGSGKKPKTVLVPPKKTPSDVDDDQMTESSNIAAEVTKASATETGQPSKRPRPAATGEIQTSGNASSSAAETSSASSTLVIPDFLQLKNVEDWNMKDVFQFLDKNKNEQFGNSPVKAIYDQEAAGSALLELTYTKLIMPPYNLKGGPADSIVSLVRKLKVAKGLAGDSAPQEPLPKKARLHDGLIANQALQESLEAAPQEDENRSKKRHKDDLPPEITASQNLFLKIKDEAPVNAEEYSNPTNILRLPFPFMGFVKPTDRFAIDDGSFEYMGREEFAQVLREIENLKGGNGYTELFIFGSIGYGKSHILAAMVCLLLQQGKRVVFLPDCRAMAKGFPEYLQAALLLTFADSVYYQKKIYNCMSVNDIHSFCRGLAKEEIRLYFIVDQLNALDNDENDNERMTNEKKGRIKVDLESITNNHYYIKSASANWKSALHVKQKQMNERKVSLFGGLTESEMRNWWTNYKNYLPKCEEGEKEQIEDITGRSPLLLRALFQYQGKNFNDVEDNFLNTAELQAVIENVQNFMEQKKVNLSSHEWKGYVETMHECILHRKVRNSSHLDHRYFYVSSTGGNYSCGLARDTIARLLRHYGEDAFFITTGITALKDFKNNSSVLGFLVEQMCLSSIAHKGLKSLEFPNMKTIVFSQPYPEYDLSHKYALYVPSAYNFKAIDGLILDLSKAKQAHLIPIQITIAQTHSNSQENFYANWNNWIGRFENHQLQTTFLWIEKNKRGLEELEEEKKKRRSGTVLVHPQYNVLHITVEDVNKELGETLARVLDGRISE